MTLTVEKTDKAMYVNIYNVVLNNTCKRRYVLILNGSTPSRKKVQLSVKLPSDWLHKTTKIWLGNRNEVFECD